MSNAAALNLPYNGTPETGLPFVRRLWWGIRDPLDFLTTMEARYGPIVMLRQGHSFVLFHPDYIKHVLQDNHPNYGKGERYYRALSPLMGNGLFTSEGAFWLRQRRLIQPAFHRKHLDAFAGIALTCVDSMLDRWSALSKANQTIALRRELTGLSLRTQILILFGTEAEREIDRLVDAVYLVHSEINLATQFLPVHLPAWVPTPGRRRFARGLRYIDEFVYRVITARRKLADPGNDLLALLLKATDQENGTGMDNLQLRDELVTMINGGHDTVTDSIFWSLVLLCRHPQKKQELRERILGANGSSAPTPDSLREMDLLHRVFHEALRLYPPAWAFARKAQNDDCIDGNKIPAGSTVVLSPFVTHRSPRYWDQPLSFDPDRFLPASMEGRPRFAYFPFGGGPRQCIGMHLALMEVPLILTRILQRFDYEIVSGSDVVPSPRISLRPRNDVFLRLRSV